MQKLHSMPALPDGGFSCILHLSRHCVPPPALPDGSSTRSTRFRPRSAKDMYNSCLILPLWFALPTKISQYTGKRIRTPYVNGAAPCNARAPPGSGNSFPGSIIKHRPDAFSWLTRQKSFVKVKSAWIFACNCKDIEPLQ